MARSSSRSSRGSSSSRSAPAARPSQPAAYQSAPPAQQSGGMLSNVAGSIMSGFTSGIGFSVANRAVDAVMGPRQTEVVHRQEAAPAPAAAPAVNGAANACGWYEDEVKACMKQSSDLSFCQQQFEALKQCQQKY
jgi:coiled-coil-helix-coiled-coil-helix domain-containing protein 10